VPRAVVAAFGLIELGAGATGAVLGGRSALAVAACYLVLTVFAVMLLARAPGRGYWLVASDGGVFSFGDAHFAGSTGAIALNRPVVGMAATPSGRGYWFVAADGGIFAFGDAHYLGSGADRLHPGSATDIAARPDGHGYWIVTDT
jgi:ribosomal protein L24E